MRDKTNQRLVAVKKMPSSWIGLNHVDFIERHPLETERPWQDIGAMTYLNSIGWKYSCQLIGVFRDESCTEAIR